MSATLVSTMANEDDKDDSVEVRCPECGAVVKIAREKAERDMKAKCPKGHEVPLVKAL